MKREERAYLAGLIDGEGYIGVTRSRASKSAKSCRRGVSYRLMVQVHMTDRRPLDYAQRITGLGKILKKGVSQKGRRPGWTWVVWSKQASALLQSLRPFFLVKGEVADVCIKFQDAMRIPGRKGLSDDEWNFREQMWRESKALNYGPRT